MCTELRRIMYFLLCVVSQSRKNETNTACLLPGLPIVIVLFSAYVHLYFYFHLHNENKRPLVYFSNIKVYSNTERFFFKESPPVLLEILLFPQVAKVPRLRITG